jgi:hypothetical protein
LGRELSDPELGRAPQMPITGKFSLLTGNFAKFSCSLSEPRTKLVRSAKDLAILFDVAEPEKPGNVQPLRGQVQGISHYSVVSSKHYDKGIDIQFVNPHLDKNAVRQRTE